MGPHLLPCTRVLWISVLRATLNYFFCFHFSHFPRHHMNCERTQIGTNMNSWHTSPKLADRGLLLWPISNLSQLDDTGATSLPCVYTINLRLHSLQCIFSLTENAVLREATLRRSTTIINWNSFVPKLVLQPPPTGLFVHRQLWRHHQPSLYYKTNIAKCKQYWIIILMVA